MKTLTNYLQGDQAIGVAAFSSPTERGRMDRALHQFSLHGIPVLMPLDASTHYGTNKYLFSSASAVERANALHQLAQDKRVGVIIAARGGAGAHEMLPLLDWELLARHPKPLVGFSDTTALLVTLHHRSAWPCIHGPAVESTFGKAEESEPHRRSAETLLRLLRGEADPLAGRVVPRLLGERSVSGSVSGGNLSILCALAGTPWQPSFRGKILLLEETGEKPFRIYRMLLQMQQAGMLSGILGVLLGSFTNCEHEKGLGPDLKAVLTAIFGPQDVPVWGYVPTGHGNENLPVRFDATIDLP